MEQPAPKPVQPTPEDLRENALLAGRDLRSQIDHQLRSAEAMDTKAWGLVTAIGVAGGLIAPRITLATDEQRLSAALVFVAVLVTVLLCLLTIRPFADFAYGPDPGPLVEALDRWDHTAIALSVAEALEDARAKNVAAIDAKAGWFAYALVSFALSVAGLGWLVYVGAVS